MDAGVRICRPVRVLEIEGDAAGTGVVYGVFGPGTAVKLSGRVLLTLPGNELENGTISLLAVVFGHLYSFADDADIETRNNDGVIDAAGLVVVDSVRRQGCRLDGCHLRQRHAAPFVRWGCGRGGLKLSRTRNGVDTDAAADWVRNDFDLAGIPDFAGTPAFGEAFNTPGAANALVPKPDAPVGDADCASSTVTIGSVQGSGDVSRGRSVVRIEGTVVADFQTTDLEASICRMPGTEIPPPQTASSSTSRTATTLRGTATASSTSPSARSSTSPAP